MFILFTSWLALFTLKYFELMTNIGPRRWHEVLYRTIDEDPVIPCIDCFISHLECWKDATVTIAFSSLTFFAHDDSLPPNKVLTEEKMGPILTWRFRILMKESIANALLNWNCTTMFHDSNIHFAEMGARLSG